MKTNLPEKTSRNGIEYILHGVNPIPNHLDAGDANTSISWKRTVLVFTHA